MEAKWLLVTAAVVLMAAPKAFAATSAEVDATRTPGTSGSDVVNAVVDVIKAACIFNDDRQFLRRLAYVESRDGTSTDTYRANYNGGIWQVSQAMLDATTPCAGVIQPVCNTIQREFHIDWRHVTWVDLRKPLYSGLAATLYLMQRAGHNSSFIPASLEGQASYWSHYYHFGNPPITNYTTVAEKATEYDCDQAMDLVFILDSSGSITDPSFQLSLDFVAKVVEAMNVTSVVRVATLIFADAPEVKFYFHTYTTKAATLAGIRTIVRISGGTATSSALDAARNLVFTTAQGARPAGTTKRVAVLITDGQSNNMALTSMAAQLLRDEAGVTIFSIGVGGYDKAELLAVASEPKCSHVSTLEDFTVINNIISEIQRSTCKAHMALTANTTFTGHDPGVPHIFTNPGNHSTVAVNVTCGIANVYVSYTNPNPNPALYAEMFTATEGHPTYLTTEANANGQHMYMTVIGSLLPATAEGLRNCTDFTYEVTLLENNYHVMCCFGVSCRECTDAELKQDHRIRDVVCSSPEQFHNPCTPSALEAGRFIFAYAYDPTKFIRCDYRGQAYLTLCPNGEVFNPATMICGYVTPGSNSLNPLPTDYPNPCTPAHIAAQYFYFAYTPDRRMYIHCDLWGDAFLVQCPEQEVWSQHDQVCVEDRPQHVTPAATTPAPLVNPCTPEQIAAGHFYFPYPCDHTRFIHCDITGIYWVQFCPGGLYYDPATFICMVNDPQAGSTHGCD